MSSHSHRCIIHPQHNRVGVCALCLQERLVAIVDQESKAHKLLLSCSSTTGTASDGAYHSFSSSSAREHHSQRSPPTAQQNSSAVAASLAAPAELSSNNPFTTEQPLPPPPPPPPNPSSILHKLKLRALISVPPSPERVFPKNVAGSHSPSPKIFYKKNRLFLPIKSRKNSSVSEFADGPYPQSKICPEGSDDAPSTICVGHKKASLRSLFHQSEVLPDATNSTASRGTEMASDADSVERRHRIEQFSAAMCSPGFAPSLKVAALSDYKQTHTAHEFSTDCRVCPPVRGTSTEHSSTSSWVASLFQRKKHKATSKSRSNALSTASEATLVNGILEASARSSVDFARVSMDSAGTTPSLKQIIRSRMRREEAEAMATTCTNGVASKMKGTQGQPPVATELYKTQMNATFEPLTGNAHACHEPFPTERSSNITSSAINLSGTMLSSTAGMGVDSKFFDDHEDHGPEQVRNFPRSRSWGRAAWSRTQSSQSSTASPQHLLWVSSKQHVANNNHGSVKFSSHPQHQHHYLTSTPKHPAMDGPAPRDSRVGFGFYFSPFRRSKRQGCAAIPSGKQS